VLFVHGYFADATVFTEWLGFFANRGHPAYAVHLRGRGGTRPDTDLGAASIDDFTDDAAAVARELDRPAVVGHSMGGLIAQRLAERDLVRAAALIAPAPPRGISVLSPGLVIRQLKYLPAILGSRLVHPSARDLRALVLNHLAPAEQDAVLAQLIPDSGRAGRDMSITGVPVDARRVRCPVLVLVGDDDRFIPPRVVARVAARYGAPLQTLAGHGHMVIVEPDWRTAADLVVRWLADVAA
jgi:pimeloyl-ACP methyl ester carboxylesterase